MNLWRKTVFFRATTFELAKISRKIERKVIELKQDREKLLRTKVVSYDLGWFRPPEMQNSWISIWLQSWKSKDSMDAKMK